jgi:hypothetical protein
MASSFGCFSRAPDSDRTGLFHQTRLEVPSKLRNTGVVEGESRFEGTARLSCCFVDAL